MQCITYSNICNNTWRRIFGWNALLLSNCTWIYTFIITISSTYIIKARLLYYDGYLGDYNKCEYMKNILPFNKQTTTIKNGVYIDNKMFMRVGVFDKFFASNEQCCEWLREIKIVKI